MKVTYYIDVMSSWCHWTEPGWDALRQRYANRVSFDWRIALMDAGEFPKTREACDWAYRRSGTITKSTYMLNSEWLQPERKGDYVAPNLVAEAGRGLGVNDDSLRRALARAGMIDGRPIGDMAEAVAAGAEASGLDSEELKRAAESSEVRTLVDASTEVFREHQLNQRPSFILENAIGDKSVFCGQWRFEPVAAAIEAMLADADGYAVHKAHFGDPPAE